MTGGVIGRPRELAAGEAFLDAVPSGAAAFIVDGEPGIGKTTVWREIIKRATDRSSMVLSCQPAQTETKLAFAALGDLLGGLSDATLAVLPDPQRRALEAALLRADPVGAALDHRAVAAAVVFTLRILAENEPVVVAIDDAHWLDAPSARALEFAARRLGSLPVGLLVSARTMTAGALPLGLASAFPGERLQHLRLGPLSLGALSQLLRTAGVRPSRPVLRQIEQASGGNPFFALEIARSLERSGLPTQGEMLPLPASLAELVADQVSGLPSRTRQALVLAVGLSHPTVELVQRGVPNARSALAKAEQNGVIRIEEGCVRFTHPLFGSAAYESFPPEKRRELHGILAGLVTDVEERARHLALAADGPDPRVAAVLEKAAAKARRRGAPEAAGGLLEQALHLTPETRVADRLRQTLGAGEDHFHAGDTRRARTLLEPLIAELPVGSARGEALRLLGEVRYSDDSNAEALALLEEALAEAGDDSRLVARVHLDLAWARHASGDVPAAAPHVQAALGHAESLGDRGLLAQALASTVLVDVLLGRGTDAAKLERAVELEDWDEPAIVVFRPSYSAGFIAALEGDVETAHSWLARVRRELAARGQENDLPLVGLLATIVECLRGDLVSAADIAEEAVATSHWLESPVNRALALCAMAHVDAYRGHVESARAAADEALGLFRGIGLAYGPIWPLSTLGFLALSLGDVAGTDRALRPLADAVAAMGLGEPANASFLPDEIEALVALGELDLAEALATRLAEQGHALDRPWALATAARCRGLLLAARGDLDGALAALKEAIRHHERLDMPVELARTMLVLGLVRRRRREKSAAREGLDRAREIFARVGTPLWERKACAEIGRLGIRRAPAGLSETEERVARLAASGLTNRDVAAALFISQKTVEVNLTRAYRKLGIRSRAELGSWLSGQEGAPAPVGDLLQT